MKEIKRILKPDDKIILFELNPLNPGTQYIFKNDPIDFNAKMLTSWYAKKYVRKQDWSQLNIMGFIQKFYTGFAGQNRILLGFRLEDCTHVS